MLSIATAKHRSPTFTGSRGTPLTIASIVKGLLKAKHGEQAEVLNKKMEQTAVTGVGSNGGRSR
jgi:hypothetical protein